MANSLDIGVALENLMLGISNHIPVIKFSVSLELEQICLFVEEHGMVSNTGFI